MSGIDLGKFERIDLTSPYALTLDIATRAKGFYSFLDTQDAYWLITCADNGTNRSLLITAMSNGNFKLLETIDIKQKSQEDLAEVRSRINNRWFGFLFWDSDYPEYDPVCLAIWDETEQVWHTRL